jgi:hypothetical protein
MAQIALKKSPSGTKGCVCCRNLLDFFSVIFWIAAALAFIADWYDPGQGMARVGYAVVAVIIVSGFFSFWQEYRIEQMLAALQKLLPHKARVLRDSSVVEVTSNSWSAILSFWSTETAFLPIAASLKASGPASTPRRQPVSRPPSR